MFVRSEVKGQLVVSAFEQPHGTSNSRTICGLFTVKPTTLHHNRKKRGWFDVWVVYHVTPRVCHGFHQRNGTRLSLELADRNRRRKEQEINLAC